MKPSDKRGAWRSETALQRLRRCLAFLRAGDFLTAAEQVKVMRRVAKWKAKHALRKVDRRIVDKNPGKPPSEMRDSIAERFRQFHFDNPQVYRHIVRLARELYRRGRERIGMKGLYEQIRWHIALGDIRIHGEYMLNNDYTSRYVRMLVAEFPAYKGIFELRHLRAP